MGEKKRNAAYVGYGASAGASEGYSTCKNQITPEAIASQQTGRSEKEENCRDATITGDRCKLYFQESGTVIGLPWSDPEETVNGKLALYGLAVLIRRMHGLTE